MMFSTLVPRNIHTSSLSVSERFCIFLILESNNVKINKKVAVLPRKSTIKSLERVLFQFFEQFHSIMPQMCRNETEAFEYIHQLDNHFDQIRICQNVEIEDLPQKLDRRIKEKLLTKLDPIIIG